MHQIFPHTAKLFCIILSCFIGLVSCESTEKVLPIESSPKSISATFKAELKTSFCAFNVVQIKDSAFFGYGVTWKDAEGKIYHNVFSVRNHCDFNDAHIKVDETFFCSIVDKPIVNTCAACLGFMETPKLSHNIQVVK